MKITCRNCDGEMETLEIKKFEINQFMDGGFEAEATELDNHIFLLFGERLGTVVIEDREVENALTVKIDARNLDVIKNTLEVINNQVFNQGGSFSDYDKKLLDALLGDNWINKYAIGEKQI